MGKTSTACQDWKRSHKQKKSLSENGAFVIFEGQGSIEIDFKDRKVHRFGNLLFGYDLIDKIPIGSTLRTARDRFFAAVNISNPNFSDSKFIVRGSSFINDGGQDLTKKFNLKPDRLSRQHKQLFEDRRNELQQLKDQADNELFARINVDLLSDAETLTGIIITPQNCHLVA